MHHFMSVTFKFSLNDIIHYLFLQKLTSYKISPILKPNFVLATHSPSPWAFGKTSTIG